MTVEIYRGSGRFPDRALGQITWHTFSFGAHYDPGRVALGPMVCHDEHLLGRGHGFETHHHSGIAIVTWVLSGALEHRDSLGGAGVLEPGSVGVLYAGDGVDHSELAVAPQTRFVQVWLRSDQPPSYAVLPVAAHEGSFVEACRVEGATFSVAQLAAGQSVTLPAGDRPSGYDGTSDIGYPPVTGAERPVVPERGELRHLFIARGGLLRSSLAEPAQAGDAFVVRGADDVTVSAAVPTELLLWTLPG